MCYQAIQEVNGRDPLCDSQHRHLQLIFYIEDLGLATKTRYMQVLFFFLSQLALDNLELWVVNLDGRSDMPRLLGTRGYGYQSFTGTVLEYGRKNLDTGI